jgi:hypothetical protein
LEFGVASFLFLIPFILKPETAQTQADEWFISYKIWSPGFRAAGVIAAVISMRTDAAARYSLVARK